MTKTEDGKLPGICHLLRNGRNLQGQGLSSPITIISEGRGGGRKVVYKRGGERTEGSNKSVHPFSRAQAVSAGVPTAEHQMLPSFVN